MNRSMIFALSFSALAMVATSGAAQDGRKRKPLPTLSIDPACLAKVPWFVDPTAEDMQLFGCRPVADIPAPDAEGWVRFETSDGAIIQVQRPMIWNPRKGQISFKVRYNGGGSMTSVYTISGGPVKAGKLKAGTFKVAS